MNPDLLGQLRLRQVEVGADALEFGRPHGGVCNHRLIVTIGTFSVKSCVRALASPPPGAPPPASGWPRRCRRPARRPSALSNGRLYKKSYRSSAAIHPVGGPRRPDRV